MAGQDTAFYVIAATRMASVIRDLHDVGVHQCPHDGGRCAALMDAESVLRALDVRPSHPVAEIIDDIEEK